jgi:tight adherence protein B
VGLGAILFLIGRFVLFPSQGVLSLPMSLGLAIPAVVLPRFVLQFLQNRRVTRFENQLAQTVDVLAGALQAGSSLPQSFEMVAREMPDPVGEEFNRLVQEAAFAVPLDQALRNMTIRMPSLDLEMLVTAINIQYRVGGNLSHILKTIAHTIRERVRLRGVLSTLTAQARLSSYIISGMPVVVVLALFVISPGYIIKLFDPGITRIMLISGIMGIISGFYVMKRISAIEV